MIFAQKKTCAFLSYEFLISCCHMMTCFVFQSFVSCSLGVGSVGFVVIPYAVGNALMALIGGYLAKYVGRVSIVTVGELYMLHGFVIMSLFHICVNTIVWYTWEVY